MRLPPPARLLLPCLLLAGLPVALVAIIVQAF